MGRRIHGGLARPSAEPCDERDLLKRRASRLAGKGELRKAAIVLRDLVARHESAAAWVLLGDMLVRARRTDEGLDAFRQGLWLHRQGGADRRVRTVARLIVALDPADAKMARLAA